MKIPASLKSMSPVEIVCFVVFMIYIVFPIGTPEFAAPYFDSALGMVVLFIVTIALFVYTNPVLGVLFIFVAYEILRRSSGSAGNNRAVIMKYTPTQVEKDEDLRKMNQVVEKTVEEEVIEVRAPIDKPQPTEYVVTAFKPVAEKMEGASLV